MGKAIVILMLLTAVLGGVGIWYTNTRAFWAPLEGPVTLTVEVQGKPIDLPVGDVTAAVSSSSPLGFRACFSHTAPQELLAIPHRERPAPTVAPGWFDCFDAAAIAQLIAEGEAHAFTGWTNARYGIDRIVALTADGRGWAWHELNDCGDKAYDGTVVAPECPDRSTWTPLTEGE